LSIGLAARPATVNTPTIFAVSVEKNLVTSRPIDRNNDDGASSLASAEADPDGSDDTSAGEPSTLAGATACADAIGAHPTTRQKTTSDGTFIAAPALADVRGMSRQIGSASAVEDAEMQSVDGNYR
jgi:hypothetical protein